MLEYCSCESKYKSRVGASRVNEPLTLSVYGSAPCAAVILRKEGEGHVPVRYEMERTSFGFRLSVTITTSGLYFYRFDIGGKLYGSDDMCRLTENGEEFLQLVYEGDFHKLRGGLIYQIFPDRFAPSGEPDEHWLSTPRFTPDDSGRYNTEFYGGTLKGIQKRLDYIKSLNVTHIYLNPIFASPSNHRYDTSDYERIDPRLGDENDLADLIEAARERNIGILLDGVFSHTGDDSKYFDRYGTYGTGAYQSKDSPYFEWYDFFDYPDGYRSWWGIKSLPEVNETCPSYIEYMLGESGIVRKWESLGIAGWRLDVADELPDGFLDRLRAVSKVTLIGEVWENAARKFAYGSRRRYFSGQLDGVTDYPIRNGIINYVKFGDNTDLVRTIRQLIGDYPSEVFSSLMNVIDTHDTVRILTALSDGELPQDKAQRANVLYGEEAVGRLMVASLIQYFLPGVPCLFYGDEAGLSGCEDPFCRRAYPYGRENERLLAHYRRLGKLRSDYADFFDGAAYERSPSKEVFVLDRLCERGTLTLCVNLSAFDADFARSGCAEVLFNGKKVFETTIKG